MQKIPGRVLMAFAVAFLGAWMIAWGAAPHIPTPTLTLPDITATGQPVSTVSATPTPTPSAPVAPTPTPASTIVAPTGTPVPAPSVTAAPTAPATKQPMADPVGNPVQVVVKSAKTGELLVSTGLVGVNIADGARWSPAAGRAEWLTSYAKPGELSQYRSIVAAHVSGGGKPGVFYGLIKAQPGDTVQVAYGRSGHITQVVTFVITRVEDPGKGDVIHDSQYDWVWNAAPGEPKDRVVSLFTCDPTAPRVDGHSVRNIVVQAVRTS